MSITPTIAETAHSALLVFIVMNGPCAVSMTPNTTSTSVPPTYTRSWVAPTRSALSRKKMAETPASVNSSHVAARTMLCVTTVAMAHSPVTPAVNQNKNASIGCFLRLSSRESGGDSRSLLRSLIPRQVCHRPHARHPLARLRGDKRNQLVNEQPERQYEQRENHISNRFDCHRRQQQLP